MKKIQLIGGIMVILASMLRGEVTVKFNNSIPFQTENVIKESLILTFKVDNAGNVTLETSAPQTVQQPVLNAIKAWNGPVGTISYPGAFNTTFTLELSPKGGSGLKVAAFMEPGGLGVGGNNAWRIDNDGGEAIIINMKIPAGQLNFSTINWSSVQVKTTQMLATGSFGSVKSLLNAEVGSWDVSAEGFMFQNNQSLLLGTPVTGDVKAGYTLSGFTFDVVAPGELPLRVLGCL